MIDTDFLAHLRVFDGEDQRHAQLERGLIEDPFFATGGSNAEVEGLVLVDPPGADSLHTLLARYPGSRGAVFVALPLQRAAEGERFEAAGADVLMKLPVRVDELGVRLKSAIKRARVVGDPARLAERGPGNLIGASERMRYLYELITRVACTEANTLVVGETGTGKELVARAIHEISARSQQPFVAVNLSAVPPDLLESELFGHAAGAFTGAHGARVGKLEAAHGGTLFLDEIGDFPLAAQVKLLRLIQEREFSRVGENEVRRTSFRLISATHRDLDAMVEEGSFREDLYYRLNVVQLDLPPLRERGEDVILLARHFLELGATGRGADFVLGLDALQALRSHPWPGNVRELKHRIESVVAMAIAGEPLSAKHFRSRRRRRFADRGGPGTTLVDELVESETGLDDALSKLERRALAQALSMTEGNRSEAARLLKLPRQTLQSRLRKYGLS